MFTAILLDGTKTPVSIMLNPRDGKPASISWGGSATNPARHFNFVRSVTRDKGNPGEKEVLVYKLVGLSLDKIVLGLREGGKPDGRPMSVGAQGAQMADEFLYPEKYAEVAVAA